MSSVQQMLLAAGADPYYQLVSLLLHGDGTNGSTSIADSSRLNLPVQTRVSTVISTAQSLYGGSSLFFPGNQGGSGTNIVLYDWNTNLHLASSDFTIEFWVYRISSSYAFGRILNMGGGVNIAWPSYQINYDDTDSSYVCFAGSSTNTGITVGAETGAGGRFGQVPLNTWTHVAFTRQGNTWRGFVNGVLGLTISGNSSALYNSSTRGLQIGGRYDNTWNSGTPQVPIAGYLEELRITKGVARYTANFTPPSAPFSNF